MSVSKLILPGKKTADEVRKEMLAKLGDVSGLHVYHNWALGMIYVTEKMGSILMSDRTKEEALWQGKVCLIVKLGPSAFKNTDDGKWVWEPPITVGDFVVGRASDGINRLVNGQMCRLFRDTTVTEKVDHPDNIY